MLNLEKLISDKNIRQLEGLLSGSININLDDLVSYDGILPHFDGGVRYSGKITYLHLAVIRDQVHTVRLLLERGANPAIFSSGFSYKSGYRRIEGSVSPLELAIYFERHECVEVFSEFDTDSPKEASYDLGLLSVIHQCKWDSAKRYLDILRRTSFLPNELMHFSLSFEGRQNYFFIVLLKAYGMKDVEYRSTEYAAKYRRWFPFLITQKTLLQAAIDRTDSRLQAIVLLSEEFCKFVVAVISGDVKFIQEALGSQDNSAAYEELILGNPCLHMAIKAKQYDVILALVKSGFALTRKDDQNQTPLQLADALGDWSAIQSLLIFREYSELLKYAIIYADINYIHSLFSNQSSRPDSLNIELKDQRCHFFAFFIALSYLEPTERRTALRDQLSQSSGMKNQDCPNEILYELILKDTSILCNGDNLSCFERLRSSFLVCLLEEDKDRVVQLIQIDKSFYNFVKDCLRLRGGSALEKVKLIASWETTLNSDVEFLRNLAEQNDIAQLKHMFIWSRESTLTDGEFIYRLVIENDVDSSIVLALAKHGGNKKAVTRYIDTLQEPSKREAALNCRATGHCLCEFYDVPRGRIRAGLRLWGSCLSVGGFFSGFSPSNAGASAGAAILGEDVNQRRRGKCSCC